MTYWDFMWGVFFPALGTMVVPAIVFAVMITVFLMEWRYHRKEDEKCAKWRSDRARYAGRDSKADGVQRPPSPPVDEVLSRNGDTPSAGSKPRPPAG